MAIGFPRIAIVLLFAVVSLAVAQNTTSDAVIYDTVRRELALDADVRGGAIEVTVEAGEVTLAGQVRDEKARKKAVKIANGVKGVTKVASELKLFGEK